MGLRHTFPMQTVRTFVNTAYLQSGADRYS